VRHESFQSGIPVDAKATITRVAFSLVGAGIFQLAWLAFCIPAFKMDSLALKVIGWTSGPIIVGAGFAAGVWVSERLGTTRRTPFLHAFAWTLIACSIGAGVVFWYGPMLIVFGMFVAGTVSVALREVVLLRKADQE
jgi:hypothetical protein